MAKKDAVTKQVAESFVEFCGQIDYDTILTKLPEFNKQQGAKYALNSMLISITEHIAPIGLPSDGEPDMDDGHEVLVETETPIMVVPGFDFSDIDFSFVNTAINAVHEYDLDLKRANELADQAYSIKRGELHEITAEIDVLQREIKNAKAVVKTSSANFNAVVSQKYLSFVEAIPVGKAMDAALCNMDKLDDYQVQKAVEAAVYVWNQIQASKDLEQHRLDILSAESKISQFENALEAAFTSNNELISRMNALGREANEIRKKYGKGNLWTK